MTAALVIANDLHDRYDASHPRRAGGRVVNVDEAELERRLDAGEWLTPGEAAKLIGVSRSKMHNMLIAGEVRSTTKPRSAHRICNPADVRRELDAARNAKAAAGGEG